MVNARKTKFDLDSKKELMICPNCGSPRIDYASLERRSGAIIGIGIPEKYFCKKCGYLGSIVIEVNRNDFRKIKKKFGKVSRKTILKASKSLLRRKQKELRAKTSTEVLKPAFTGTLVVFFVIAIFFLFPRYEVLKGPIPENLSATAGSSTIIGISPQERMVWTENQTVTTGFNLYLVIQNTSIIDLDRALGIGGLSAFLVPVFFLIFLAALIAIMIFSHWHRVRFFG